MILKEKKKLVPYEKYFVLNGYPGGGRATNPPTIADASAKNTFFFTCSQSQQQDAQKGKCAKCMIFYSQKCVKIFLPQKGFRSFTVTLYKLSSIPLYTIS